VAEAPGHYLKIEAPLGNRPEALALIEREVMDLAARLIGGGKRRESPVQASATQTVAPPAKEEVVRTSASMVRPAREPKGRRGKGVTTISDLRLDEAGLLDLAATLKQRCGTGGTVRDGRIEIQGDQHERLAAVLGGMGYRVKRVGG
jgi:predicted translation initiation factor SUI1